MKGYMSLIAQQTPAAPGPGGTPPPTGGGGWEFMIGLMLLIGVFYYMMWRGSRRDRQKQQDMLNALKRNDRVQTIGGMLGTVVEVRDNEVVVKIDESNNVKVRFVRSAIREVLGEAPAGK
jgi:preprotein translocase subunit YajC